MSDDPVLMEEFLTESEELLECMDQDMVLLEGQPQNADILNRIFRALHTIKGTSGFLGFDPIVRLSHQAEDVLNLLRRDEIRVTTAIMDALLQSRDQLGVMLRDIRQGGLKSYALDGLIAELVRLQKPSGATAAGLVQPASPKGKAAALPLIPIAPVRIVEEAASGALPAETASPAASPAATSSAKTTLPAESPAKTADAQAHTLRVDVGKLDELVNLIGELVLERNRLAQISRDLSSLQEDPRVIAEALSLSASRLSFITDELQTTGLKTRMVAIEAVFRKFPRLVRDVAHSLGKDVELIVRGEDTELDKTMVELIGDPLIHLVRNSLDHGLEMPDLRVSKGKPRKGAIRQEARQEGDQIVISIRDDGAGIDPERVARKAIEKGLVTVERARVLSRAEVLDFIFLPGFSTAEKTSNLSGRGVGMDVVRSNLKKMNGSVQLESEVGVGTTIQLRLPLTLAILPVLLVRVREDVYALPLRSVIETARIHPREVHKVEGGEILHLRDRTLPLLRLGRIFQQAEAEDGDGRAVILGLGERRVALLVDQLLGQESTVIKPLSSLFHHIACLAGATISGDGRVRLVLDPAGILAAAEGMQELAARGASA
jgi:two-component system chemotaxis sensor kinase CheA